MLYAECTQFSINIVITIFAHNDVTVNTEEYVEYKAI